MPETCPICSSPLSKEIVYQHTMTTAAYDYCCRYNDSHFYGKRIHTQNIDGIKIDDKDLISHIKFIFKKSSPRLYVKIDYLNEESSIWTTAADPRPFIIPHTINTDFSDMDKLKSKIQTYLLFS